MRVSKDRLNQIKKKYNVDTLWSWSRINSFHSDPYSYYLNYVLHKPQTIKDSIYGFEGGECHDIIERFYNNEIKFGAQTVIKCDLKIIKHVVVDKTNNLTKETKEYIVTFVHSWEDSETFQRYSKRYKKLKYDQRQQTLDFNFDE